MDTDPIAEAELTALFAALWRRYVAIAPLAEDIQAGLAALGNPIVTDHVAFRTFDVAPLGLARFVAWFEARGYHVTGRYDFVDKQLDAVSLSHADGAHPRVFFSQLRTAAFSPALRAVVARCAAEVDPARDPLELMTAAPTWPPITVDDYARLLAESEYAAWTAAFGLRANHFTLALNALVTHRGVAAVNAWLEARGIALNTAGGAVKGTPADLLEQSSTLASRVPWAFAGGVVRDIPGCYYELALRHVDPATGRLYEGFVPTSADKIFESTHARPRTA